MVSTLRILCHCTSHMLQDTLMRLPPPVIGTGPCVQIPAAPPLELQMYLLQQDLYTKSYRCAWYYWPAWGDEVLLHWLLRQTPNIGFAEVQDSSEQSRFLEKHVAGSQETLTTISVLVLLCLSFHRFSCGDNPS